MIMLPLHGQNTAAV